MSRAYAAIFNIHLLELFQYRSAAIAGIVTQFVFGLIRWQVLMIFLLNDPSATVFDAEDLTAYIWLGQAFLGFILFRPDGDLAESIRSGNIASELLRPVDPYRVWLARALARRLAPTLLRCAPLLAISFFCGWIPLPPTVGALVACLTALLLAALLAATLAVLLAETAFWTIGAEGAGALVPPLIWFFSGITVPLPMLPDWLQSIASWTPFAGMLDKPLQIWIGSAPAGPLLGQQLLWIVLLICAGRLIANHGLRRLTVAGG